jgi:ParB-like chromosome segregation protein Spo0J
MVNRPDSDVEIERLQLRFAGARVIDERAVRRLMQSIDACGQLVACIAVDDGAAAGAASPLVLIDGYRRVAALRRLGRDTARVQCCNGTIGQALAQLLACAQSRAMLAIEQALLLRELIEAHQLSQREAARCCGRDASWVQRRLLLLAALPDAVLDAVRGGAVSSWAAVRVFVPLARANSDHADRLLAQLAAQRLSTRELRAWFDHYQGAQRAQRDRMVEHPRLFIDSLNERQRERDAKRLREGPEREVMGELGHLHSLLERVRRRLEPLSTPVAAPLARACARAHAALPEVASELRRLCHDPDGDPQQRPHAAPTGHEPARDEQAAGTVA